LGGLILASSARRGPRPKDREMENPVQFLQEVRAEGSKVTWPTRKETLVTTGGVFVMVLAASAFFFLADQVLRLFVGLILGIGR
jgi:preprotein translocase subunit SecE